MASENIPEPGPTTAAVVSGTAVAAGHGGPGGDTAGSVASDGPGSDAAAQEARAAEDRANADFEARLAAYAQSSGWSPVAARVVARDARLGIDPEHPGASEHWSFSSHVVAARGFV